VVFYQRYLITIFGSVNWCGLSFFSLTSHNHQLEA